MDLTESIIPKSDQINADDLMAGPITATIEDVRKGTAEQPVDVILKEYPGRAYRPSKSMRRVLVSAWGKEGANYVGKKLTLFRNPDIAFGGIKLGGVEIAAMSHIEKPLTVALTTTRSKRKNFTVAVLASAPSRDFLAELKLAGDDVDAIKSLGTAARETGASEQVLEQIRAAYKRVSA